MKLETAVGRLFFVFMVLLWVPLLQQQFHFMNEKKLFGYAPPQAQVPLSWKGWWDGTCQTTENNYLNDNMGFRRLLVRANNQLEYSVFRKVHAQNVVIGKQNYFMDLGYISDYWGKRYAGDSVLRARLRKLKKIQDTLNKLGKTVVIVYAPSKAYFYPEYIPDYLQKPESLQSNYHGARRIGDSLGLNIIDCNAWLRQLKGGRDRIFGRPGIHWTEYGARLALDSITRYINRVGHVYVPQPISEKMERTIYPRDQEWDIEAASNLLFNATHDTFTHPIVTYAADDDTTVVKPSIIFLGDSFIWTMVGNFMMKPISDDWEFWYYFNEVYNQKVIEGKADSKKIEHYDWMNSLLHKDVIVIVGTTTNLVELGGGFVDQSYKYFGFDRQQ